MASDFTNFNAGCHGAVPLETAIYSEIHLLIALIPVGRPNRVRSRKISLRAVKSEPCWII